MLHDSGQVVSTEKAYKLPGSASLYYDTLYQWEVSVQDKYGAWSNYTSRGWINISVGTITGLTAAADNFGAKISLDWGDSTATGLSGYNVLRSTTQGGPYTKVNDNLITASNYQDSNIQTGQRYYYVVQAVVNGIPASGNSAEVSALASFSAWYIGAFKFDGPSKISKKRQRAQSKRVVLGKSKRVVQDRGFVGEELELEIYLTDDAYSTGQSKYDSLITELSVTSPVSIRDPFGRSWKVAPGDFEDDQLITGKLEYVVKINLTEVN
jgi:hypothetical protein